MTPLLEVGQHDEPGPVGRAEVGPPVEDVGAVDEQRSRRTGDRDLLVGEGPLGEVVGPAGDGIAGSQAGTTLVGP